MRSGAREWSLHSLASSSEQKPCSVATFSDNFEIFPVSRAYFLWYISLYIVNISVNSLLKLLRSAQGQKGRRTEFGR